VLFDAICRQHGIDHILTQPRSPTTTGKIERFHRSMRAEFLSDCGPLASVKIAQQAFDEWVDLQHHPSTPGAADGHLSLTVQRRGVYAQREDDTGAC
jgi:transposase InsO family protein